MTFMINFLFVHIESAVYYEYYINNCIVFN